MNFVCAKNSIEMRKIEPFPSDVEKVKNMWGKAIPENLLLIGGYDHFSWAYICRDNSDEPGIYRGEILDSNVSYQGRFRYDHPKGKKISKYVFEDYEMTFLEYDKVVFIQANTSPPVDFFRLIPIDSDGYQLRKSQVIE